MALQASADDLVHSHKNCLESSGYDGLRHQRLTERWLGLTETKLQYEIVLILCELPVVPLDWVLLDWLRWRRWRSVLEPELAGGYALDLCGDYV